MTIDYSQWSVQHLAMDIVSVSEFKATCLAIIERVRQTGQHVLITKHGEPVAELIPPQPAAGSRRGFLGRLHDTAVIVGDITAPVVEPSEWDALR
jgi:prevent-host-death family protein